MVIKADGYASMKQVVFDDHDNAHPRFHSIIKIIICLLCACSAPVFRSSGFDIFQLEMDLS